MATQFNVDEILESEVMCGEPVSDEANQKSTDRGELWYRYLAIRVRKSQLNMQDIDRACFFLANNCISINAKEFFKTASRSSVLEKTAFLNTCLVARSKFPTTAREKAWTKFNAAYQDHMLSVTSLTGSVQASMWLCLQLFQQLLDDNYPISSVQSEDAALHDLDVPLSDDMKDIIYHIGGSIVQKLKQRYLRLKDSAQKEERLQCLRKFSQEEDQASVLTSALNRGGLIFLRQTPKEFFVLLEKKVCLLFSKNESSSSQNFSTMCCQDQNILSAYTEMTSDCDVGDESKEAVCLSIMQLFFKIRIHHECKKYMEKVKSTTAVSAKGLRKGLKLEPSKK